MSTFNLGHFFEDHTILTIPNIGTLEVNKTAPRFDVPTNTFEPPKFKPYFTQDLNQKVDDSWFTLNKYLQVADAKKLKETMLLEIEKGTGLHINGIGTLVRMPLEGYDFITDERESKSLPPIPATLFLSQHRKHSINAGGQNYTNVEMQDILNAPQPKKSYFWLWVTLALVLISAVGIGFYFYKNNFRF